MNGIFISYRRDDSAGHSGRIHDRLSIHFGEDRVFRDVEDIGVGDDFVDVIHDAVGKCGVLLVVIGPDWLGITDAEGRRRLDDPKDFVRLEVASALGRREIRVIPVLVNGATMPKPDELPEDLKALSTRNALEVRDTRFDDDVTHLIKAIGGARRRRLARVAGLAALPLAGALAVFVVLSTGAPEVQADLSLYEGGGELQGDDSAAIVGVVFPEDSAPAGPPPEIENRVAQPWDQYVVSYEFQRRNDDEVRIASALPYRDLLARGGVVMGGGAYIDWEWPRLSVKVINNSERTIVLDQILLEVKESAIDSEPIIMVREVLQQPATFSVVNYGWGVARTPEIEVAITELAACADTAWRELPMSALSLADAQPYQHRYEGVSGSPQFGAPGTEALFDVGQLVPGSLARQRMACLLGVMSYRNDAGAEQAFRFKTQISLEGLGPLAGLGISAEYAIYLEAGKSGYVKTREISLEIPPGRAEHFLLRVSTDKSARFDLSVSLRAVGGELIAVDDVTLDVLTPIYDPLDLRSPRKRR
jgi:hypothetical protein